MQRHMRDVGDESRLRSQLAQEVLSNFRTNTLDCTTLIADQVDVNVIINGVIRRRAVTYVRMGYQPNLFEHLKVAINRGQVDPAGCALHVGQDFVRRSMSQILDCL